MAGEHNENLIPPKIGLCNISRNEQEHNQLSRTEIYTWLKKIAPISVYRASKVMGIAYTTMSQAIKEFEFAGLLKTRLMLGGTRATRIIFFEPGDQDVSD